MLLNYVVINYHEYAPNNDHEHAQDYLPQFVTDAFISTFQHGPHRKYGPCEKYYCPKINHIGLYFFSRFNDSLALSNLRFNDSI